MSSLQTESLVDCLPLEYLSHQTGTPTGIDPPLSLWPWAGRRLPAPEISKLKLARRSTKLGYLLSNDGDFIIEDYSGENFELTSTPDKPPSARCCLAPTMRSWPGW